MTAIAKHPTQIRLEVERAFDESNLIDYSCAEIERLERELAQAVNSFSDGATSGALELQMRTAEALDAERYRYLRNAAGQWAGDECGPMVCSGCSDNFEYLRGEEVDDEVDEAMAEWKAAGCPLPKEATK